MEKNRTILGKKWDGWKVLLFLMLLALSYSISSQEAIEAYSCHANSLKQHFGVLCMHV